PGLYCGQALSSEAPGQGLIHESQADRSRSPGQTVARRTVAGPPASTSTASPATTPVRPKVVRPAKDLSAADQTCSCSEVTTMTAATTTSACAARKISVPSGPHR